MKAHPFYAATYNGTDTYHTAAAERLLRVPKLSLDECRAALELPGLQKSVATALQRRIRKLEKEAACAPS